LFSLITMEALSTEGLRLTDLPKSPAMRATGLEGRRNDKIGFEELKYILCGRDF
jgi:hypothetical protein